MKTILKNAGILLAITLVAAVALSFVYELTKEPIALAEQAAKAEAYQVVYEQAAGFVPVDGAAATVKEFNATLSGTTVDEVLAAVDAAGNRLGYVLSVSAKGYGGPVTLALGVDMSGRMVGYAVLAHEESPGFGANCENEDVKQQFIGITSADAVDGISGATITSDALRADAQAALDLVALLEGGDAA